MPSRPGKDLGAQRGEILLRGFVLIVLLVVLGFGVFGFLATFEPQETGRGHLAWRWLYRCVVLLSVVGIVAVVARSVRRRE